MKTLLGEVEFEGNVAQCFHSTMLGDSPCLPLILRTEAEILEQRLTVRNAVDITALTQVVWLEKQIPLGGICFNVVPEFSLAWIILSFTHPEHRGKSINSIVHGYFEEMLIRQGIGEIASHVSASNHARIRSCEKVGMKPTFLRMSKQLKG
jgi:GNAT superfamily N-acetyltransferase